MGLWALVKLWCPSVLQKSRTRQPQGSPPTPAIPRFHDLFVSLRSSSVHTPHCRRDRGLKAVNILYTCRTQLILYQWQTLWIEGIFPSLWKYWKVRATQQRASRQSWMTAHSLGLTSGNTVKVSPLIQIQTETTIIRDRREARTYRPLNTQPRRPEVSSWIAVQGGPGEQAVNPVCWWITFYSSWILVCEARLDLLLSNWLQSCCPACVLIWDHQQKICTHVWAHKRALKGQTGTLLPSTNT